MSEVKEDREGAEDGGGEPIATPDLSITITNTDDGRVPAPARGPAPDLNLAGVTMTADPITPRVPALGSPASLPLLEVPLENYEMIGEQGRGGIGIVRRARDLRLDREVAIKELQRDSHQARQRFEREMRITAKLQHPGIVPVHEAGRWPDGSPFYTMKLVEGRSLKALIVERSTLEHRLTLLPHAIAIAETIAYSHSKGVIHRDLKPSNVIVGAYGETVVIDWGLAKDVNKDRDEGPEFGPYRTPVEPGLTATGTVMGTPAYMAPEQASASETSKRSDVYAIGAILYHIVAGSAPYRGSTSKAVLDQLMASPPISLQSLVPGISSELCAIVTKAMERDPSMRYADAGALAEDLQRFQAGQLVRAYEYSSAALFKRWLRRHQRTVSVVALALGVVAVVSTVAVRNVIVERNRAAVAQRLAEQRAAQLEDSVREVGAKANSLLLSEASRRVAEDPVKALVVLAQYPRDGADWGRVHTIAREALAIGLPSSAIAIGAAAQAGAAITRDGLTTAVVTREGATLHGGPHSAQMKKWNFEIDPRDQVLAVLWLDEPDFVVGLRSGRLALFTSAESPIEFSPLHGQIADVAVSSNRRYIATACQDGSVWVYDHVEGRGRVVLRHDGAVTDIEFAGGLLVSVGMDGILRRADVSRGINAPSIMHLRVGNGGLSTVAINDDVHGGDVAVGTEAGDLVLIDGPSLRIRSRLRQYGSRVMQLEWVHDSNSILVATNDHVVSSLSKDGTAETIIASGDGFAQSEDGSRIIVAGTTGTATLYDRHTSWRRSIKSHDSPILQVAVVADGSFITIGYDNTLRWWSDSLWPLRTFKYHGAGAYVDSFPNREDFLIASDTGQVLLCRANGECRETRLDHRGSTVARLGPPGQPIVAAEVATGILYVLDDNLAERRRIDLADGLLDVRLANSSLAVITRTGNRLLLGDALEGELVVVHPCAHVVRVRWMPSGQLLVGCETGELIVLERTGDVVSRSHPQTSNQKGRLDGIGAFANGALLELLDHRELYRVADDMPTPLTTCDSTSKMLYEASDGDMYLSDCGSRVRVIHADGLDESPDFGTGGLADFDASRTSHTVAIGTTHALIVWDYLAGTTAIVGYTMSAYNVEVLPEERAVVTASGPGSVQLWPLTSLPAAPTDDSLLHAWLKHQSARFSEVETSFVTPDSKQ